jgi:hypothetical protein
LSRSLTREALGIAAASVCLIGPALPAAAVDVRITMISASERGPSDKALTQYRPRLRRLMGYRSFRVVGEERRRCAVQNDAAFAIPGGRQLRVVPQGMRDRAVRLRVQLLDGSRPLMDTDLRLQNRGMILVAVDPPEGPAKEKLLIMLRAKR